MKLLITIKNTRVLLHTIQNHILRSRLGSNYTIAYKKFDDGYLIIIGRESKNMQFFVMPIGLKLRGDGHSPDRLFRRIIVNYGNKLKGM